MRIKIPLILLMTYLTSQVTSYQFLDVASAPGSLFTQSQMKQPSDKSLGMKKPKKEENRPTQQKKYPWDPSKAKETKFVETDTMRRFITPEEEPFQEDYYVDYEFEFAKSGVKNDNFEQKRNKDIMARL